jgi:hypothetical protein
MEKWVPILPEKMPELAATSTAKHGQKNRHRRKTARAERSYRTHRPGDEFSSPFALER